MGKTLDKHVLSNGMVVLGEPMEQVASAAFMFLLPCGSATLPLGCSGTGNIIVDWIYRGAGSRDSRQLVDAMDGLGLHRSSSVSANNISLGGVLEASNLSNALELYADVVLRPSLDADQFELSRQLAIHELMGLDDDPRQKVMQLLAEQFYPEPLGRPSTGKLEDLQALTADKCASIVKDGFNVGNSIFAVAGKYDFDKLCTLLEKLFGDLPGNTVAPIEIGKTGEKYVHHHHEGAQVHIGLMTSAPSINSDYYYDVRSAVSILSGGMSSRLFTEVREKRGLCYAVGARYGTMRDYGSIRCYAGTTPEKAQETLDVILAEFKRLADGISDCEMQRARVGLKSAVIMDSESTIARAGGIAADHYLLGRVRSIAELKEKIEQTSVDSVLGFLNKDKFENFTVVTIGPTEIKVP